MKRNFSLWLGLLALALSPVLAQTPAPAPTTGKIHGHVSNPTGTSQSGGSVSLVSTGLGGSNGKAPAFPVDSNGNYSGEAAPGNYNAIYRAPNTPPDKIADEIDGVKVVAGQDVVQDIDMSRKEYIDKLSPDEKKQLEDLKKKNAEAMKVNEVIKGINADLRTVTQDFKDAEGAHAAAVAALGATASKSDLDAKEAEIRTAKYSEAETLMLKDTAAKADASVLWAQLGQAQVGLARVQNDSKKYDDAAASFKKVLDLEADAKKPNPAAQGAANAGLGEIYARTGKVAEANAAYDAAVKVNPPQTVFYLKNEMVIFFQVGNSDAQAAVADELIKADPTVAIAYYLKGSGLLSKAVADPKTNKLIAPPGCEEAFQKYLDLAPTGQYAPDAKSILASLQATLPTTGPTKSSKKK
ncbi:MAG: carboxypeptidase-like regulatory domain-containing protein [Terracidiphilus sp.]|jgi:tetratricopeptide (TPR) repeat protein